MLGFTKGFLIRLCIESYKETLSKTQHFPKFQKNIFKVRKNIHFGGVEKKIGV